MGRYAKFVVALSGAIVICAQVLSQGAITQRDWIIVGTSLLAALGVLQVPNKPADDPGDGT